VNPSFCGKMEEDLRVPQVGNPWCTQWRLQRWGSARVFDYCLYCRTRACLLCMFVPPTTSLIKVVNSGSLHWALSVFIYFRFTLTFGVNFAGDLNKNLSVASSLEHVRSRFPRPHPSEPELPCAIKYFSKFNAYQIECFFETMDLHRTFWIPIQWMFRI